jgi:hypothetical protein
MIQELNVDEFLSSLKDRDGEVIHIGGIEYYEIIVALIELFKLQDSFTHSHFPIANCFKFS